MRLLLRIPKYTILQIDQRVYHLVSFRRNFQPEAAPRIVIVSYLPNDLAFQTLRVCVQSIQRFTPEPHEIWVVDNHSPRSFARKLLSLPGINLVYNLTEPLPADARRKYSFFKKSQQANSAQKNWGSYANAVALEIGIRLIDPTSKYLMTMHMDAMPSKTGWLSYLHSKFKGRVRAAGVRMDITRLPEGVLHVLGYLVDFQLFKELNLDFFPQLSESNLGYDVGDRAILSIQMAGYDIFACPNSLLDEKLIESLAPDNPFRALHVDRSFDDAGNVIFLHLGRGVLKSSGEVSKGTTTEEWIKFADENLLS